MSPMSNSQTSLRVSCYNTRGLPKCSRDLCLRQDIINVLDNCDILCIQETWYSKQDLAFLNTLHNEFNCYGVSTTDFRDGITAGHPPGGVAVFWRKLLDPIIKPLSLTCDWCAGIELSLESKKLYIFNVYLPYQCPGNTDKYLECLGTIHSFINELDSTCYAIFGDWNADPCDLDNSLFASHLIDFCDDNNCILADKALLPSDSYTYVSSAWGSKSWLDHLLVSQDVFDILRDIAIHYDLSDDDHIPLSAKLDVSLLPDTDANTNNVEPKLKWGNLSDSERNTYKTLTDSLLNSVSIPCAVYCTDVNCEDESHKDLIGQFYDDLVKCLKKASDEAFQTPNGRPFSCKPGWNDYVKEIYDKSRQSYLMWSRAGKPRNGPIFDIHKQNKAHCKRAIRYIKAHETALRSEALAQKLSHRDPKSFWKEVKSINNSRTPLPTSIEGVSGSCNIAELWRKHFDNLFNCINGEKASVCEKEEMLSYNDISISTYELEAAIKRLDCNKSCGLDGIYAEHIHYSSKRLLVLLSLCFSSFLTHGFLPESIISVVLVPIIKDKSGKLMSQDNYRPIALASILSKIIEIILCDRLDMVLNTCCNQFGFKRKLGTDHCIYTLKEMISSYNMSNSSLYVCFLDASKAFDRINHSILFKKLRDRGAPTYIIRLLVFWYCNQTVRVRWGSVYSDSFHVTNGVRQGGILSPYLFNIYMDNLSIQLNAQHIGCAMGDTVINHLMYADDLVVISPSPVGLNKLLRICEQYGVSHDILYNAKKSCCMVFRAASFRNIACPEFLLYDKPLVRVTHVRYLGHIFKDDLTDDLDIDRQCRVLYAQGNVLLRKFHMCSYSVKITLFRSYCSSLYTAHLWWRYKSGTIRKFRIAYHNILKLLLGFSKYSSNGVICTVFDVPSCSAVVRNLVYRFRCRLDHSNCLFISEILCSDLRFTSLIREHWMSLLYCT